MAEMYLVTLSEGFGNDIEKQRWMLDQMCNRAEYLGKATCTTMNSTWGEKSSLISMLVRLYGATGRDYHGLKELLEEKIKEAEANRSEEEVAHADQHFKDRRTFLETEAIALEERFEKNPERVQLKDMKARRFFKPRR
ncbi:hypothetical protein SynMITS9220_01588 [Synechococcus sp. MIT S9220]|uniref:hypothetical protein n=2 Tax=Synechococcus TaxID=1129 RepID=UPI00185F769F|nr:hypothetical protein SynMITS9220_01588 [Synechococcus sp. MIT S9220]